MYLFEGLLKHNHSVALLDLLLIIEQSLIQMPFSLFFSFIRSIHFPVDSIIGSVHIKLNFNFKFPVICCLSPQFVQSFNRELTLTFDF